MAKTKKLYPNRAWNILRLAILWARKGRSIKRKLFLDLHLLKASKRDSRNSILRHYGEHELSFDRTPMIHVKMYKPTSMRFKLPCFTTDPIDFDCEDPHFSYAIRDATATTSGGSFDHHDSGEDDGEEKIDNYGDEEIDERADKFIAEFYAQLKLQRQISKLKYQ